MRCVECTEFREGCLQKHNNNSGKSPRCRPSNTGSNIPLSRLHNFAEYMGRMHNNFKNFPKFMHNFIKDNLKEARCLISVA